MAKEKVIVVMPAYNAASTLERTINDIPPGSVDEIILVDDASRDNTVDIAKRLGLTVVEHQNNLGYGANQKTCYGLALSKKADYVVMIHPDYQYDSRLINSAIDILRLGVCDVLLGNRVRTRKECLASGMPLYKYLANRFLTIIDNFALGQNLGEFHSGFRAYRRGVLETIPFHNNSDDFVFDAQLLIQAVHFGFTIGDIPIPVRYFKEASSIRLWRSVIYGLQSLGVLTVFYLHRLGLIKSPLFNPKQPRVNDKI
ncbi:MAG: glycosyltransferase family 2 protein [Candidatus Omnitrophica bacterium]|jgi:glycosyltransferase involved in cell wall biosynthesis|nr:glycosyltransferase family 2 protein [Candidatus Omnitrophota bacterium]MDD5079954.1 glycosyltransferase family 2 protein [Candidatus Omnitrophota bacterium]